MTETPNAFRAKQAAKNQGSRVLKCAFCRQVSDMPEDRKAQLVEAWPEKDISSATICQQLADWQVKTSTSVVSGHRSGLRSLCVARVAAGWAVES